MDYKMFSRVFRLFSHYPSLDKLMILISNRVRFIFIFVLIFMWFRNYSYQKITANALISVAFSMLINILFKLFYYKPRPFINHRVGILIPAKTDSSFPSKHTLLAFAVATSILLQKRILGSIMTGLAIVTGISRIWVGHHFPSDIIGSAIIGGFSSFFVNKYSRLLNYYKTFK